MIPLGVDCPGQVEKAPARIEDGVKGMLVFSVGYELGMTLYDGILTPFSNLFHVPLKCRALSPPPSRDPGRDDDPD
jgi:hypothetical protein